MNNWSKEKLEKYKIWNQISKEGQFVIYWDLKEQAELKRRLKELDAKPSSPSVMDDFIKGK